MAYDRAITDLNTYRMAGTSFSLIAALSDAANTSGEDVGSHNHMKEWCQLFPSYQRSSLRSTFFHPSRASALNCHHRMLLLIFSTLLFWKERMLAVILASKTLRRLWNCGAE